MHSKRSRILDIVCRLDIGRKLAGLLWSRFAFLSKGVTDAVLYTEGTTPVLKDKNSGWALRCEKSSGQSLMTLVGSLPCSSRQHPEITG